MLVDIVTYLHLSSVRDKYTTYYNMFFTSVVDEYYILTKVVYHNESYECCCFTPI